MVDELDVKILKILRRDARLSFRKIARELDVATGTVEARIRRMEKEGIIERYHVDLDYSKLGYTIATIVGIIGKKGKEEELEKRLLRNKNVFGVYTVTGEFDVFIAARFKNMEELSDFIRKELSHDCVERTTTFLILKTGKEVHTLLD